MLTVPFPVLSDRSQVPGLFPDCRYCMNNYEMLAGRYFAHLEDERGEQRSQSLTGNMLLNRANDSAWVRNFTTDMLSLNLPSHLFWCLILDLEINWLCSQLWITFKRKRSDTYIFMKKEVLVLGDKSFSEEALQLILIIGQIKQENNMYLCQLLSSRQVGK